MPDEARLAATLERLSGTTPKKLGLLAAVSGGPDSMAMLLLLTKLRPGALVAATVDHGLRAEAAAEGEMVANWCRAHGIVHHVLHPERPITGNLQANARTARYALLGQCRVAQGLDFVLTAHHGDDQVETMLMRLNRGAGLSGLGSIRERNGKVLRPLLEWRRDELQMIVEHHILPHVHDPSNVDPAYDRARLRAALRQAPGIVDPRRLAQSAFALQEADEAMQWVLARLWKERVEVRAEGLWLDLADLPTALQRALLCRAVESPSERAPRGAVIGRAIAAAREGRKASVGKWLLEGGTKWRLTIAPPRGQPPPGARPTEP